MSEAHYPAARLESLADVCLGVFLFADFLGHLHDLFGCPAVRGALQDANSGGYGAVEIGLGGGCYARAECGGVDAVLGVENEVLVYESGILFRGLFAEEHIEKVGRVAEFGVRIEGFFAFSDAGMGRDDSGGLGCEPDTLAQGCFGGVVFGIWIIRGKG